jgi:hypothetical protein
MQSRTTDPLDGGLFATPPERAITRRDDPETAQAAGMHASVDRSDRKIAAAILSIMQRHQDRMYTDELLHEALSVAGHQWSDGRVRHGRLYLQDVGLIVPTKEKARTKQGGMTRQWRLTERGKAGAI